MNGGTRPIFQPPAAPPAERPPVPLVLEAGLPAAPLDDQLRYWRQGAATAALAGQVPPAACWLLGQPWPPAGLVAWEAGALLLVLLSRLAALIWLARRAAARETAQQDAVKKYWDATLGALRTLPDTQARVLAEWSHRYNGGVWPPPSEQAPPTINAEQTRQELAATRAELHELRALLQQAQAGSAGGPERAIYTPPPVPIEQVTQHLDDPALILGTAYDNGPTRRLIAAAWRGEKITMRMMTGAGWMTRPEWTDLTALLGEKGILEHAGQTDPWKLSKAYKLPTEAACHAAVLQRLLVTCVAPTALPGDLAA